MKQIQTRAQPERQLNLGNNSQSSKIRILSIAPLNQNLNQNFPQCRQHTPELSIHNQKNNSINQQSKRGDQIELNILNNNDLKEKKIQELINKVETNNKIKIYPQNNLPPKLQTKQQNTYHKTPTRKQDQQNYIQEKKINFTNTIQQKNNVLTESNNSAESQKNQDILTSQEANNYHYENIEQKTNYKQVQTIQPKNSSLIQNISIESEKNQKIFTTQEADIDMYASIMIEQKMNCKSCCFIIDQDAFVTSCQHTFHYNCLRDSIKRQLNNGQYIITCVCETKFSQSLIKNLQAVLKENFFDKLILNQIERMKVLYQPFIAECGKCKYFCIEIENPKSKIGDYAEYICPNCTQRDNSFNETYY